MNIKTHAALAALALGAFAFSASANAQLLSTNQLSQKASLSSEFILDSDMDSIDAASSKLNQLVCDTNCDLSSVGDSGEMNYVIGTIPRHISGAVMDWSIPLLQANSNHATADSQSRCSHLAQQMCDAPNVFPRSFAHCGSIRMSHGNGLLNSFTVRCH